MIFTVCVSSSSRTFPSVSTLNKHQIPICKSLLDTRGTTERACRAQHAAPALGWGGVSGGLGDRGPLRRFRFPYLFANPSTRTTCRTSNRNPHQTHTACIRTKSSRWPMSQRPCFRSPPSWAPWAVWALQAWLQAAAVLGRLGASRLRRSLTPRYVARATAERAPRLSFETGCSST